MTTRFKRMVLCLTLGIAVFLGFAWVVFERGVYEDSAARPPPATPPPVAAEVADSEAVVELVEGSVQRSVKGGW